MGVKIVCVLDSTQWPIMKGRFIPVVIDQGRVHHIRWMVVRKAEQIGERLRLYTRDGYTEIRVKDVDDVKES